MNFFSSRGWTGFLLFLVFVTAAHAGPPITKVNSSSYIHSGDTDENGDYISDGSHDRFEFTLPCAGVLNVTITGLQHAVLSTPWGDAEDSSESGSLSYSKTVTSGGEVALEVYGPSWMSGYYTISAIFTPAFQGPTASFTATPFSGPAPLSVAMNAAGSTCPDGTIVSYEWDMVNNGGVWSTGVTSSHLYQSGVHTLRLTVTDSHNLTATTTRTITVNSPPSVTALAAGPIVGVGQPVTITGNSTDPDTNLTSLSLEYQAPGSSTWVAGTSGAGTLWGGAAVASKSLAKSFTLSSAGLWRFRAIATDNLAVSVTSATVIVTAGPDITLPAPPTLATASNITALTFLLSWSGATDDVGVTGYEVRRDGVSIGTTSTASMSVSVPTGNTSYQMEVRARDAAGNWSPWSAVKTVTTIPLQPPVANFVASPLNAPLGSTVTFTTPGCSDPNGTITTYGWDFDGNGSTDATGATTTRAFSKPGIYPVKLTVNSSSGLSGTFTRLIPVGLPMQTIMSTSAHVSAGDTDENGDYISDGSTEYHTAYAQNGGILVVVISGTAYLKAGISGEYGGAGWGEDSSGSSYLVVSGPVPAGECQIDVSGMNNWVQGDYTLTVGLAQAPRPPVPAFSASAWYGVAPLTITFDASGTTSLDTFIGSYVWDFGANGTTTTTSPVVTRTFATPGTYVAKLTISDGFSAAVSVTKTIVVNGPAAKIVTAPTGGDFDPGTSVALSVVATGSPAPSYQWRRGATAISGATNATLGLGPLGPGDAGNYSVVVSNTLGAETSSDVVVVINPPAAAPVVTTQPDHQSVVAGDQTTLVSVVMGFPKPTFQWYKDNVAVSGGTAATLTIPSTRAVDAGTYKVVATNWLGTATSSTATVTVQGNRFLLEPTGGISSLATAKGGTPGRRIGIAAWPVMNPVPPNLNFFGWQTRSFGGVVDRIDWENTIVTMANAEFSLQPLYCTGDFARTTISSQQSVVAVGQTVTAVATTTNPAPGVNYAMIDYSLDMGATWKWWLGNSAGSGGATGPSTLSVGVSVPTSAVGKILFRAMGGNFNSPNWATNLSAYNYYLVTVADQAPPAVTIQPTPSSATVDAGETVTLRAEANGVPSPTYQWNKNGVPIANANSPTLTLNRVIEGDAGSYTLTASNSLGSITSNAAALTIRPRPVVTSPDSATAIAGQNFSYQVTAAFTGPAYAPVTYYAFGYPRNLRFDATTGLLSGIPERSGTYPVLITASNSLFTSEFSVVILNVGEAPDELRIVSQLTDVTAVAGGSAVFSPVVISRPAPSFQWMKNGVAIAGATSPQLQLNSLQMADAGSYSFVVSNTAKGSLTSSPAQLVVTAAAQAPTISLQPVNRSGPLGAVVEFSVTGAGSPTPSYQWCKEGVAIVGATTPTLIVGPLQAASVGAYTVRLENTAGSIVSTPASLTIDNNLTGDNDTDLVPNGVEWALGTNPSAAASNDAGANAPTRLKIHIP